MRKFAILLFCAVVLTNCPLALAANPPSPEEQVEALEKRFFQHPFKKDNLEHRILRIEKFTFGESHKGTPEGRLALLTNVFAKQDSFNPKKTHSKVSPSKKVTQKSAPDSALKGDYPHITFLEDELLGQEYKGEAIAHRLARLENHVFGRVSTSDDLSFRVDALEKYAVAQLHKRPFIREKINNHRISRNVSHIPLRFPSINPPNPDDLAAANDTPPPPHSRLLSRVAWCEKHTFGKTYPQLHLLQRLHKLNAHLFPSDHRKDILLMDRVDVMVKKVVLQQHPRKTAYLK